MITTQMAPSRIASSTLPIAARMKLAMAKHFGLDLHVGRQARLGVGQHLIDAGIQVEGVGARLFLNRQDHGRLAVDAA